MKKIGLAVCYDTKNYGSQLQVLATLKIIEKLGYDPVIIRYKKKITPTFIMQTIPRLFNIAFLKNKVHIKRRNREIQAHPDVWNCIKERNAEFDRFVKDQFGKYLSKEYAGWENLVKYSAIDYDLFLCGSDQLWLPFNLGSHFYTLEFAPDNKKKVAYATSFGVSKIPCFQRKRTARYLNRFYALSTRELTGQKIISSLTQKKAEIVCDPTLLFEDKSWDELLPSKKIINEPYIFSFLLGDNLAHRKIAEKLAKQTGLKIVSCPFLDNYVEADRKFGDYQMFHCSASDFVNLIRHAEYILTDSFHCSVFSILYHKKFMTFNRFGDDANSRNSRIDSLCSLLELSSRRYDGDINIIFDEIDYAKVDKKIVSFREKSLIFLKDTLN